MKLIYCNVIGCFIIDTNGNVIDKIIFKNYEDYKNKEKYKQELLKKYKYAKEPSKKQIENIKKIFSCKDFKKINTLISIQKIKESVDFNIDIIQKINLIDDIEKIINILINRLKEWFYYYFPEIIKSINDNKKLTYTIFKLLNDEINETAIIKKEFLYDNKSMFKVQIKDKKLMIKISKKLINLYELKEEINKSLEHDMNKFVPNLTKIAGVTIGARLIKHAGSLKKLVFMPSSAIQLCGAEKSLFRFLRTKKGCPKHGLIYNNQYVQKAKNKGKAARIIANKISLAAKIDFYKGKYIADKLIKDINKALKINEKV